MLWRFINADKYFVYSPCTLHVYRTLWIVRHAPPRSHSTSIFHCSRLQRADVRVSHPRSLLLQAYDCPVPAELNKLTVQRWPVAVAKQLFTLRDECDSFVSSRSLVFLNNRRVTHFTLSFNEKCRGNDKGASSIYKHSAKSLHRLPDSWHLIKGPFRWTEH